MKPIWGLNEEGELNGCFRDLGYQGLWYIMGEGSIIGACSFFLKQMTGQSEQVILP